MTLKELQEELKSLQDLRKRVKKAVANPALHNLGENESLIELLSYIDMQIQYNDIRSQETRLQASIEASIKAEGLLHRGFELIRGKTPDQDGRVSFLKRVWTDSMLENLNNRRDEHERLQTHMLESAPDIRKLLDELKLPDNNILRRNLPAIVATVKPERTRHVRERGGWAKALDKCVEVNGKSVAYRTAANWLRWNAVGVARTFCLKFGVVAEEFDRESLIKLLNTNPEARERFHHQLNSAKKRADNRK